MALCAGVGGLELGISLALNHIGKTSRLVCAVEREAAAAASLVASMEAGWLHPAPVWSDMLTFDARPWRGLVHILASGDPCQDNSVAGKRAGADGERFLAPEVCRLAAECRPDLVFRENVPGNADGQLHAIVPTLEGLGYRVAAGIFSSAETGNTMRRERLFIMAERQDEPGRLGAGPERERLSDAGGRGGELDGPECTERRALHNSCGADREHPLSQWQEGPDGAGSPSEGLVVSASEGPLPGTHGRLYRGEEGGRPRDAEPQRRGFEMDRAHGIRRWSEGHQRSASGDALQSSRILPPAVIPGPTDSRWIDVLDRFPELQPALSEEEAQSHLRRGIDAMAHRVERLRATGNGVDPLVAAYAFLSLEALLREGTGTTGELAVRWAA